MQTEPARTWVGGLARQLDKVGAVNAHLNRLKSVKADLKHMAQHPNYTHWICELDRMIARLEDDKRRILYSISLGVTDDIASTG